MNSLRISVVIPVHNGAGFLSRVLEGLSASDRRPDEIIVVDDGSTDDSGARARRHGCRVIDLPEGPFGPAGARNRGVAAARGDVIVFVDADVVVHRDSLSRIEGYLTRHPGVAGLFGSYDDDPPERGLVSLYKNLLHHHVHQHSRREATTFWAGCGAIRRDVLLSTGGFDESQRRPAIEDIELGHRLTRSGHVIWSCPDVLSTHLKRWTFANLIATDIARRAIPWSRLILASGTLPDDLNLGRAQRLGALSAWCALASLVLAVFTPWGLLGVVPALAVCWACNAALLRLFRRSGGLGFAVGASGLQWLYLLYSSLTFATIAATRPFQRGRAAFARSQPPPLLCNIEVSGSLTR